MSSDDVAIRVENLSKCYQIYDRPQDRLRQSIMPRLQRLAGRTPTQYFREFWALRDVSFEIRRGETVGIIGRNGSGKSTLLQIICGTLTPTSGTVETHGRIAALLELGSGFNPEFTGRENVYMNGAVLGLSTEDIDARFDDIAAFADIGDFIGQPVKTYSSGMMVRLAIAVAINVNPEILIIDEALSVGDELFQRKCFSKIESIRDDGATILFVSHSGAQIVELCDRAVLLDSGELLAHGFPKKIVGLYQKLIYAPDEYREAIREQLTENYVECAAPDDFATSLDIHADSLMAESLALNECFDPHLVPTSTIEYESHGAHIENPVILDMDGNQINNLAGGNTYRYTYVVRFNRSAYNVRFGMMIKTTSGIELGGGSSAVRIKNSIPVVRAGQAFRVEFAFVCALNTGTYFLNAGVAGHVNGNDGYLHRLVDIAAFRVRPDIRDYVTGVVDFNCVPTVKEITAE